MVIRSKLPPWSIVLGLTVSLMALSGSGQVRADPLTDSFASGGKRPAHKPAAKKSAPRPAGGSRKSRVKPTVHRSPPGTPKVTNEQRAEPEEAPPEPIGRRNRESDETHADESEPARPPKGAPRKGAVTKTGGGKKKSKATQDDSEGGEESGEEGAEGKPEEEEDANEEGAFASLPPIVPRAVTLGLGGALMGRNFQFGAPATLQHESSFPRLGFVVDLETFPLLLMSSRWWRQIGLGAFYASEPSGDASVTDPMSGVSTKTSVSQSRWGIDLRMALPIGERLVVTPRLGLQAYSFTLSTKMPIVASSCTSAATMACLPDTGVQMLTIGGIVRIAASPDLGLSVGAAYLFGVGVTNRPLNQIGYEIATSVTGFAFEGGASWRLTRWLAIRMLVPVTRFGYVFHPSTATPAAATYRSATELLYGFSAGVAIFTK